MPNAITTTDGAENEIDIRDAQTGRAYIITRIPPDYGWSPGDVVIRGYGEYICPSQQNFGSPQSRDVVFVRPLRPGESVTIRED